MPIYEYECHACHERFERFVRPSSTAAPEAPACPHCGSDHLERLLSMFAVNSAATQRHNLQQGRKHAAKEVREKKHAEMEYMKHAHDSHDHDH